MKELRANGEGWKIGHVRNVTEAADKLQVAIGMFALSQVPVFGPGQVMNACMSAFVNVATKHGITPESVQQALRDIADQMPEAMAASQLLESQAGNSEETPS